MQRRQYFATFSTNKQVKWNPPSGYGDICRTEIIIYDDVS